MNILITGGSGFIGSHLTRHYTNAGHHVWVVDNLITGNKNNLAGISPDLLTFVEQDVSTYDLKDIPHVDIAFNLASPASPVQYKKHPVETMLANSQGSYHLLEFARAGKCDRIVLASTSEVYGDPLEHPQKETYWGNVNPAGERSCYDEAKRYAEAITMTYHMKYGTHVRIARIFNTYGPNMELDDGRVVSNFITQAIQAKPITIYGDGSQTRSFCYVSDLVRGLAALGETEGIDGQTINLGNPNEKTVKELAEMIKSMVQTGSEIVYHPIGQDDPKKRKPDITKAREMLNWQPEIHLEEGLTKTIEYFRSALHTI
ncbi:SDR family oxidoreductase [Candidatus Roizmanbacteria bacterium]|nr:MAG: SDR family oxidoreductase [Candidatus Roizmanbacteria bacterium]